VVWCALCLKRFLFFLIAAAGITGVPGFNGYGSKVLIHEAILHAYHLKGWESLLWLERRFVFTGGLTAAYISKIWLQAFLAKPKADLLSGERYQQKPGGDFHSLQCYSSLSGCGRSGAINKLVLPVLVGFDLKAADLAHLQHVPFWTGHELMGPVTSYGIGFDSVGSSGPV